jgi:hypothetical protein
MPAPRYNKNASTKRVKRGRIAVNMGISEEGNRLLPEFERYLVEHGKEPSDDEIKHLASFWAYQCWQERLSKGYQERETQLRAAQTDLVIEREQYQRLAKEWNDLVSILEQQLGVKVYGDGKLWVAERSGKKSKHPSLVAAFEAALQEVARNL